MMKIKFNKNRNQFNLVDSGRHYIKKSSRGQEIVQMDKWLMASTGDVFVTFTDAKGLIHQKLKVDTHEMYTWFDGDDDYGDWKTFTWDFPTEVGHLYVRPFTGRAYTFINGETKDIDNSSVTIAM